MKKKPVQKPQDESNPTKQDQAIDLMGIFTIDQEKMEYIQTKITTLTKDIDAKNIDKAKKHIDNNERYDAQYVLNTVSWTNENTKTLRQQVDEQISLMTWKMQNTIDDIYAIKNTYGSGCQQILAYPDDNICIYLRDKSIDTWAGMEYGRYIGVWHNGIHHRKYFKWRDGFTSDKDDHQRYFKRIKHVHIQRSGQTIHIIVTAENENASYKEDIEFILPIEENASQEHLSLEEEYCFLETFDDSKNMLIDQHFRKDARMPSRINLMFDPIVLPPDMIDHDVSYERPKIMDSYLDTKKGDAIIILKAQIDHDVVDGKQYERVGYRIDFYGKTKQLFRECRYESQIRSGDIVTIKAEDLL